MSFVVVSQNQPMETGEPKPASPGPSPSPIKEFTEQKKENPNESLNETKKERKGKIIVVDDERYMRDLYSAVLAGADPKIFSDPEEALRSIDEDTAVVITDFQMPGMDGIELIKEAREKLNELKAHGHQVGEVKYYLVTGAQEQAISRAKELKLEGDIVIIPKTSRIIPQVREACGLPPLL